jgi:antitoxin ParD1/3/4
MLDSGNEEEMMDVTLSDDVEQFVRTEIDSGRYNSAQEVVREGLRLLLEQTILEKRRRTKLDGQIEVGLAQLDRGEGIPGDQAFEALWDKSRRWREASLL